MNRHRRRWSAAILTAALMVAAACGREADGPGGLETVPPVGGASTASISTLATTTAVSSTTTTPSLASTDPTAPPSTAISPSTSRYEGIVAMHGQTFEHPYADWYVADLTGGAAIEGSTRIVVEVPRGEIGCGDAHRTIFLLEDAGFSASFEVVADATDAEPVWFTEGNPVFSEPAVRVRQFRVGCPPGTEAAAAQLAAQRTIWDTAGPDSYEFSMSWYVFNDSYGDYRITVVDGVATEVLRDESGVLSPATVSSELPRTIDELFDALERHVAADSFVAEYDASLGFPVTVDVDTYVEAVDDELTVRVDDFAASESGRSTTTG